MLMLMTRLLGIFVKDGKIGLAPAKPPAVVVSIVNISMGKRIRGI